MVSNDLVPNELKTWRNLSHCTLQKILTPIWKLFRKKWEMMKNFGNDVMEKGYERRILLKMG